MKRSRDGWRTTDRLTGSKSRPHTASRTTERPSHEIRRRTNRQCNSFTNECLRDLQTSFTWEEDVCSHRQLRLDWLTQATRPHIDRPSSRRKVTLQPSVTCSRPVKRDQPRRRCWCNLVWIYSGYCIFRWHFDLDKQCYFSGTTITYGRQLQPNKARSSHWRNNIVTIYLLWLQHSHYSRFYCTDVYACMAAFVGNFRLLYLDGNGSAAFFGDIWQIVPT